MEIKNFNNFESITITKNDDGTYYLKGKTNIVEYVEIYSAKIKLSVDIIDPENSDKVMMNIFYE